jgi:hypothetical protein
MSSEKAILLEVACVLCKELSVEQIAEVVAVLDEDENAVNTLLLHIFELTQNKGGKW